MNIKGLLDGRCNCHKEVVFALSRAKFCPENCCKLLEKPAQFAFPCMEGDRERLSLIT